MTLEYLTKSILLNLEWNPPGPRFCAALQMSSNCQQNKNNFAANLRTSFWKHVALCQFGRLWFGMVVVGSADQITIENVKFQPAVTVQSAAERPDQGKEEEPLQPKENLESKRKSLKKSAQKTTILELVVHANLDNGVKLQ